MTGTFTVEQLRPIKDGMTISRDAKMGQTTAVTFFSLGKDTSISQERYDVTSIYIGAKGTADFLIGDQAKKEPVSGGDCLIAVSYTHLIRDNELLVRLQKQKIPKNEQRLES